MISSCVPRHRRDSECLTPGRGQDRTGASHGHQQVVCFQHPLGPTVLASLQITRSGRPDYALLRPLSRVGGGDGQVLLVRVALLRFVSSCVPSLCLLCHCCMFTLSLLTDCYSKCVLLNKSIDCCTTHFLFFFFYLLLSFVINMCNIITVPLPVPCAANRLCCVFQCCIANQ